ncbi:RNA-directed DNA polymerase, eukaryota [Tanacetum coccineum]
MGSNKQGFLQSKADQTMRVSKSVYVSNFPDGSTSKDLWKICNDYGTVVDVFIPNKKSKVGKRFAFVRFIKVDNLDRLIQNLNTIWIGRFHLFANPVKALVSAGTLFMDEGFTVGQLLYLGGMWVMIECVNAESKVKMMRHSGVKSWDTFWNFGLVNFKRIGKKWGDVMDIEDNVDYSFGRKRLCIKTKQPSSILESFKVIFKGKIFMVRAKELFTWSPIFSGQNEGLLMMKQSSDIEEVADTVFGDNSASHVNNDGDEEKQESVDPFSIYRILRKQPDGVSKAANPSLSRPSGSTPAFRVKEERRGSGFNATSARVFDQFITGSGLVDVKMEGYAFTWTHPSGSKMSKLDRFLINMDGFDSMVAQTWNSLSHCDGNKMIRFKKKLQDLKVQIRSWVNDMRRGVNGEKDCIKNELSSIDKILDRGDDPCNTPQKSGQRSGMVTLGRVATSGTKHKSPGGKTTLKLTF